MAQPRVAWLDGLVEEISATCTSGDTDVYSPELWLGDVPLKDPCYTDTAKAAAVVVAEPNSDILFVQAAPGAGHDPTRLPCGKGTTAAANKISRERRPAFDSGAEYILEDEPPLDVVVPVTAAPPPRQSNLALPLPTQANLDPLLAELRTRDPVVARMMLPSLQQLRSTHIKGPTYSLFPDE